jgi:ribosome biogenesis GTPase
MHLYQLGWDSEFQKHFLNSGRSDCIPARVAEESKEHYKVFSEQGEFLAQITGKIRFQAGSRSDFPAVGDWVLIKPRPNETRATIETILPRKTMLIRKIAGKDLQEQVIAANIDTIFIVMSLNQDWNLRRLERYLSIGWESGSQPVVLLNKADLCENPEAYVQSASSIALSAPILALSALTGNGIEPLTGYITRGRTAAFIGSSGVGKSTIINALIGQAAQRTQPILDVDDRGRHTTTSRQMILLPHGGVVIDTPGMREIGMWESGIGISQTFEDIEEFAVNCRFRDCSHSGEPGCAVLESIEKGDLNVERLNNYHKLKAELRFIERKTNYWSGQKNKANAKRMSKAIKKLYKDRSTF